MAFSGSIHGPPAYDQPGQFCMVNRRFNRLHSSAVHLTSSSQSSPGIGSGAKRQATPTGAVEQLNTGDTRLRYRLQVGSNTRFGDVTPI